MGTYAASLGHEAAHVGIGASMQPEDVLAPSYREYGAQFMRGVKPREVLMYWGGDERGNDFSGPPHDYPWCVPIGTQCLHAAGAALAIAYRLRDNARAFSGMAAYRAVTASLGACSYPADATDGPALMRAADDAWWITTALLYGPRWVLLVPPAVLLPVAIVRRSRLTWLLLAAIGLTLVDRVVETPRGNEYIRVWINRAGNHYLIHLPVGAGM